MKPAREALVALPVHARTPEAAPTSWLNAGLPEPFANGRRAVTGSASALTAIIAELCRAASGTSSGPFQRNPKWLEASRLLNQIAWALRKRKSKYSGLRV